MVVERIQQRIGELRRELRRRNLDACVVTKPENVTYVTGFMGHDAWALVTGRMVYLITDSRYEEVAKEQCGACRIISRSKALHTETQELLGRYKSMSRVGVEASLSVSAFKSLRKALKGLSCVAVEGMVEAGRLRKDSTEVALIGKAACMAKAALDATWFSVGPGMTEAMLAGILELNFRKLGGGRAFDTIVAFGANGSYPHHVPGKRRLRKNDPILIDFGVEHLCYRCDVTRCFVYGKPSRYYEQVYGVVREAKQAAIRMVAPGVRVKDVDEAARQVIRGAGLPVYGHGTGHGVGLEVHEQPGVGPGGDGVLEAGMVVTIEPGVYIPGKVGIRLEDDVLVTAKGSRILTPMFPDTFEAACQLPNSQ